MKKFSEGQLDVKTILRNLNINRGQTILDAGCGNGYMAKKFSVLMGNTGIIYALDSNAELINTLKKEVKKTNIKTMVGDMTRITEIEKNSIDLVYLSTVFHVFSESQVAGFNQEVDRILKPGGELAIINIKKEDTPFGPPLEMRSSPYELRQKLSFIPRELVEVGEYFYMQMFEKK